MFTAQFSEFSYGYALTDNILHCGFPYTPQAPVFPSLIAEGSSGGFDVRIPLYPVPMFLQFKVPQIMRRASGKMPRTFFPPYLRMHLRTRRPNQHQLLLDWEGSGHITRYATPDFWRTRELDESFSKGSVHLQSYYIRPGSLGPLEEKPHCLAYRQGRDEFWICSEPKKLEGHFAAEVFAREIGRGIAEARRREPLEFLQTLAEEIAEATRSRVPQLDSPLVRSQGEPHRPPSQGKAPADAEAETPTVYRRLIRAAREVAYMAQIRLGCTLAITGRDK